MAKCEKCGAEVEQDAKFCPFCGENIGQNGSGEDKKSNDFSHTFDKLNDTPDYTNKYDPADVEANKGLCVCAYIGILVLIPLLAAKDSKFTRFHVNQGLVLLIFGIAVSVIVGILSRIPFVGAIIGFLASACVLALMIIGIVNAASGKAKELPIIGKIKLYN